MRPPSLPRTPLALAALFVAYPLGWLLLEAVSTPLAFWPVALRFLLVWWLPVRWWPALLLADATGALVARHLFHGTPMVGLGPWALALFPILAYMTVVAPVRRWAKAGDPDAPSRMAWLLAAGAAACTLVSPVLVLNAGSTVLGSELGARRLLDFALGDYFALMAVVPLASALRAGYLGDLLRRRTALELVLGLLVAIFLLRLGQAQPALQPSLQLLAFVPLMAMAFRHGWVGASAALAGLCLATAYGVAGTEDGGDLHARTAVLGSAALLLGAAASQLARQRERLEAQHASLRLALVDQRDLASRIVQLEDEGQRKVAEALHEQVAPPLAELRTQLSMAWRSALDERDGRLHDTLRDHAWRVQDGLERALRRLQPPAIDRRDLADLLAHGPLWEWAGEQGARWEVRLVGPVQTLPERWKSMLYRIAQAGLQQGLAEAATAFELTVEARGAGAGMELELQLDIHAPARAEVKPGINAIHDRIIAAGGRYAVTRAGSAWRHRAVFERTAF